MGQGTCPRCPANIYRMEAFIDAVKANNDGQFKLNVSGVGGWDLYPYFWLFGGVLTDDGFTKLEQIE